MMYGSADVGFLLLDGLNLLGQQTELTHKIEDLFGDSQPFGATGVWNSASPIGTKQASFTQKGLFDDTTGRTNSAVSGKGQMLRLLAFGAEGNTKGVTFRGFAGIFASIYNVLWTRNQITMAEVDYQLQAAVESPVILQELVEVTGDGDTQAASIDQSANAMVPAITIVSSSVANPSVITTLDPHGLITGDVALIAGHAGSTPSINGERVATKITDTTFSIPLNVTVAGAGGTVRRAWTKNGGAAHLHVNAITLSGRPNVTMKVRHSADNVTYVDLCAFTAVTVAGQQRVVVAAGTTVNRYLACSRAFGGAGGTPKVTFLLGFHRA